MASILTLAKTEGMLFKYGSGTGSNLSTLRSSREHLNGGGTASGPVSFMRGFDAFAGAIKSGGKTRRAAKMVILNIDHPDVVDFIDCKAIEEKKAWALIDAGYDGGFNVVGGAYDSVNYQNANHSVRVTDDFMNAVLRDGEWHTRGVTDGKKLEAYQGARTLMRKMADAAWICGDPGMQYDTTINDWHPCINTSRINASNPCSEYMFLDDSACNLASLNLMKFQRPVVEDRAAPVTSTSRRSGAPSRRPSPRWRSSSTTRAIRRRGSPRTATRSGRSGSASRTSARCSCRARCRTTASPAARTPRR